MANASYRFGFIGAGRMATALAGGLVKSALAQPAEIIASDPAVATREAFAAAVPGTKLAATNTEVATESETLILAVKPQVMPEVLSGLAPAVSGSSLVVSIAAGIPLATLEAGLPAGTRVVRVMPNTPCLIGQGASGYSGGQHASDADMQLVDRLLAAVGIAIALPESSLDAVTGLSGSGPAFVYTMIEAMSDGGVLAGLPRDVAHRLATQTVAGAADMVLETGVHPAELREAVTSPAGTTIAGLEALEQGGMRAAVIAAVKAATFRSQHLGETSK